jgi:hypothetical protein
MFCEVQTWLGYCQEHKKLQEQELSQRHNKGNKSQEMQAYVQFDIRNTKT